MLDPEPELEGDDDKSVTEIKDFAELAQVIKIGLRADAEIVKLERLDLTLKKKKEESYVTGGIYRLAPINRNAAMLLSRAPWYAFAPDTKQEIIKKSYGKMQETHYK